MTTHCLTGAVVLLVFSVIAPSVSANPQSEKAFETLQAQAAQGSGHLLDAIFGAGVALNWTNATLESERRTPLFCPPSELALNSLNYAHIALAQFKRQPTDYAKFPTEYSVEAIVKALLDGLVVTFPCK